MVGYEWKPGEHRKAHIRMGNANWCMAGVREWEGGWEMGPEYRSSESSQDLVVWEGVPGWQEVVHVLPGELTPTADFISGFSSVTFTGSAVESKYCSCSRAKFGIQILGQEAQFQF